MQKFEPTLKFKTVETRSVFSISDVDSLEFKQTLYQVISKELNSGKSGLKTIIDKVGPEVAIEISKNVLKDRLEALNSRIAK